MLKEFFLLIVMAWLVGIPGASGLLLLGLFFFYQLYSLRYRGYHGRLSGEEERSLSLSKDVDKYDMRTQGDVLPLPPVPFLNSSDPWLNTSKHVIRKWTWDRIALDTKLQNSMETTSQALTKAFKRLEDYSTRPADADHHPYSGTLAVFDSSRRTHTPLQALELVRKSRGQEVGWSNQAICALGGTFVICAESYKKAIKTHFEKEKMPEPRMMAKTDAELSRFTWKIGQFFMTLKFPTGFKDFLHSVARRLDPRDRHAIVNYREQTYYAPTTMFGASATIMKVLKLCEALGLDEQEKMCVGYSVALHWIDKYLNDNSWIRGGFLTPDRHSLLEALQGMYAYIESDPTKAATELVKMYEEADTARLEHKDQ